MPNQPIATTATRFSTDPRIDLHDAVFRAACIITTLECAVDSDLRHSENGWDSVSIMLGEARKAATRAREALGRVHSQEPAAEVTAGGRAYLVLMDILQQLHIEGDVASFTITPEMADELAAFGVESEDTEEDEDSHDRETEQAVQMRLESRNERVVSP